MGAPREVYVDPAINGDSGTGTSGDPYGDLQYAINTIAAGTTPAIDNTNGVRFNVKAGTSEVLAATLSLASYDGTPSEAAPLIIQGYTSTAGDGGIAEISGGGSYGCFAGTEDYIHLVDLKIHNSGSAVLVNLDAGAVVSNCEITNTSGGGVVCGNYGLVAGCNIYNCGGVGVTAGAYSEVHANYFANGTNDFTSAMASSAAGAVFERNIVSVDAATDGISIGHDSVRARHNTILSSGGTGEGITFTTAARFNRVVESNYIEGFSGSGGDGVDFVSITENGTIYRNNAFFGNAANESNKTAGELLIDTGNQSLAATGIAKSGSNTFANRFTYFAPVAEIQGDAYPTGARLDIGAVQHADPTGSDTPTVPVFGGNISRRV